MTPHYELFDHTADMGVRVYAPTLPHLVELAIAGLYATIGELTPANQVEDDDFHRAGSNSPELLRDLLARALLLFEAKHRMVTGVNVDEFHEQKLIATLAMAEVDFEKSVFFREVKAVTYHELGIRTLDEGYEATFIVDI